ncbi:hypothetical protein Mapa_010660 [Marchantia paleacea]|nr:hypothetical protein Mapa_010660 [Marchantia paleacea]
MLSPSIPLAFSTTLTILLLTLPLPTSWARIFSHDGGTDGGPFNYTVYYPWQLQQEDQGCVAASMGTLMSPNKNYTVKLNIVCPDRTMDPWNLSFVAGVGRRFADQFQIDGTLEFPPQDWAWRVPVGFDQPTNSCALRFTESGDLQFVVPNLKRGHNPSPPWTLERIVWSTNTSGKGAVAVQVQDSGNLVLVHSDGNTVVWKALDIPLLPLAPLNAAAKSPECVALTASLALCVSAFFLGLM